MFAAPNKVPHTQICCCIISGIISAVCGSVKLHYPGYNGWHRASVGLEGAVYYQLRQCDQCVVAVPDICIVALLCLLAPGAIVTLSRPVPPAHTIHNTNGQQINQEGALIENYSVYPCSIFSNRSRKPLKNI